VIVRLNLLTPCCRMRSLPRDDLRSPTSGLPVFQAQSTITVSNAGEMDALASASSPEVAHDALSKVRAAEGILCHQLGSPLASRRFCIVGAAAEFFMESEMTEGE
jgi:hypothetical protein